MDNQMKQQYNDYVKQKQPQPALVKNLLWAFVVGGLICDVGQFVINASVSFGFNKEEASTIGVVVMIFLGAFLTGLGVYDQIGKRAGAGSIVPITGFANSIVSPAMEFKREGYVFGVAAKMFVLAGPVLVYGIATSVIIGIIYGIFS
ncbi:MAG: Stage V sporulation protein AC (SpoVAC) [Firmicutes bacterium]|nr:Stage V sporulation protein AC (SpoVAC) [Bacillota bacterium]